MAHIFADRVLETSATLGTGTLALAGAVTTYRAFSSVMALNDTVFYGIRHQTLDEWEIGLGTYSASNQLARTAVIASSNGGSHVNLSSGTKSVFITFAARQAQFSAPVVQAVSASANIVSGAVVFSGSTASQTLTLPAGAAGMVVEVRNAASVDVTIARTGGDTIEGETSYIMGPSESARFRWSAGDWIDFN